MKPYDRNDPKFWKFGLFYYNPDDSKSVISIDTGERRKQANFAHPLTYVRIIILILGIYLLRYLQRTNIL